jgi:hypothetical protein
VKNDVGIDEAVEVTLRALAEAEGDAQHAILDRVPSFLVEPLLDAMFPNRARRPESAGEPGE